MKFFSKQTSHKLATLGCVASNDYYYSMLSGNDKPYLKGELYSHDDFDAFTIADFLSDAPYAIENCKKIWPSTKWHCIKCEREVDYTDSPCNDQQGHVFNQCLSYNYYRHKLLDSSDQEAFLWAALGGKGEK